MDFTSDGAVELSCRGDEEDEGKGGSVKPYQTGEFLVDREAMKRKTAEDRRKIWRYRRRLVWEALFGDYKDMWWVFGFTLLMFISVLSFMHFPLGTTAVFSIGFFVFGFLAPTLKEIRKNWR